MNHNNSANKVGEYQSMKNMLNLIRDLKKKQQLNEEITNNLQPQELEDEKQKFKEAVSPTVDFGSFVMNGINIEFSGVLVREQISWLFSLKEADAPVITGENILLTDDVVKTLQNLNAYYKTWSQYWGTETDNSNGNNPTNDNVDGGTGTGL